MKRAKFLWPLTHGHQHALSAAKIIRERLQANPADTSISSEVLDFYEDELAAHFEVEEEMLATVKSRCPANDPDLTRTLTDHQKMKELLNLSGSQHLLEFAELLTQHVRFEEEILFARLESIFKEEEVGLWEKILKLAAPACPRLPAPPLHNQPG
ncbi:MAG TPA: hemerythrin domain-containing protein [bacterium]|jgi:hypothetical protein|nr:hemerythrin domain-containing protein [bacterium]